jgi:hypothetical protein
MADPAGSQLPDDLEREAKKMRQLQDFEDPFDAYLKSVGAPY